MVDSEERGQPLCLLLRDHEKDFQAATCKNKGWVRRGAADGESAKDGAFEKERFAFELQKGAGNFLQTLGRVEMGNFCHPGQQV